MEKTEQHISLAQLKNWWFPVLGAVVIILGSLVVLIPQVERLLEARASISNQQKILNRLQTKAGQITQLDTTYIESMSRVVAMALPDHKPYYELFALLQQVAGQTGVVMGDFDLNPGSLATDTATVKHDKKGYVSLETEVSITGATSQVVQFVALLSRSLPLVTVTSIAMSGDQNEFDVRQAKIGMIVSYMVESVRTAGKVEGDLAQLTDLDYQLLDSLSRYTSPFEGLATGSAFPDYNRQDIFAF